MSDERLLAGGPFGVDLMMVCVSPRPVLLRVNLVRWVAALLALALAAPVRAEVQRTLHDFTASGARARQMRAAGRTGVAAEAKGPAGVCVFCHISHNAKPSMGLWNRSLPAVTYKIYESSTLQARPSQPTGSSRLCLSCHDGTLALGALRVKPRGLQFTAGPLQGAASLGTDLSDDHPISFVYDTTLAVRQGQLVEPSSLPPAVRLDKSGQLQCTSCHDAHEDKNEKFLRIDNRGSRLCTACHRIKGWLDSAHAVSPATQTRTGTNPWPHTSYTTVADNGCENCHRQHGAGHAERLIIDRVVSEGCFVCHDGSVAAKDVRRAFQALSYHPVQTSEATHQPDEDPLFMKRHVACADCHEPHSVRSSAQPSSGTAPRGPVGSLETLGAIDGVNASGARIRQARMEYEVCYKCHGLQEEATFLRAPMFLLTRNDNVTNVRLQFATNNVSFHPVEAVGRNASIQGLEAGYTPSTMMSCTDCHNNNEGDTAGSQGARGPHGSVYEPILVREYQVVDPSTESFQSYALCYRCHNRTALFSDTGGFPHQLHVVQQQASCAVCHDAHGSRKNPYLVNFLVRGKTGTEVVKPSSSTRLEFQSLGRGRGQCSLTCHGCDHNGTAYPASGQPACGTTRSPANRPAGGLLPKR